MLVYISNKRVSYAIKMSVIISKRETFFSPNVWLEYPRCDVIPPKLTVIFRPRLSHFRIIADWAIFDVNKLLEIFI
jgi:hypothetical protein